MKAYGGGGVAPHINWMEVSGQLLPRSFYVKNTGGSHWIEAWVGLRTGLDIEVNRRISTSPGNRTPVFQPEASA